MNILEYFGFKCKEKPVTKNKYERIQKILNEATIDDSKETSQEKGGLDCSITNADELSKILKEIESAKGETEDLEQKIKNKSFLDYCSIVKYFKSLNKYVEGVSRDIFRVSRKNFIKQEKPGFEDDGYMSEDDGYMRFDFNTDDLVTISFYKNFDFWGEIHIKERDDKDFQEFYEKVLERDPTKKFIFEDLRAYWKEYRKELESLALNYYKDQLKDCKDRKDYVKNVWEFA